MIEIKRIHADAIPRALALAERYRLLNEPEQAASICYDILAVDPENTGAVRTLLLAVTEQFSLRRNTRLEEAERLAAKMPTEFERQYYLGVAYERWARAKLQSGEHTAMALGWLHKAMEFYENAEGLRPMGNDDAILRWNSCARLLHHLPERSEGEHLHMFGD